MDLRAAALTLLVLAVPAAAQEVDGPPLANCLARIKPEALARGVPDALYDRLTAGMLSDVSVLGFLDDQPEHVTPIWDYLALLVDAEKISDGKRALLEHREILERVSRAYGVDVHTLAALWGVEADFGKTIGRRMIFRSLATLGCMAPRRRDYFKSEFIAALRVAATGEVDPAKMRGSWAGAFGHPQFMPTVWFRLAVDFDGDGKRDIDRLHARLPRLDGELPEESGLGFRPILGLRGEAASQFQRSAGGAHEEAGARALDRARREARRRAAAHGRGRGGSDLAGRERGARVSRIQELRRDLHL